MIRGAITLARVVTHIEIRGAPVLDTVVPQEIITRAQHRQSLFVKLRVTAGLFPRSNLFGEIFQTLALDMCFTEVIPGIYDEPARKQENKQDREARGFHYSAPSAGAS